MQAETDWSATLYLMLNKYRRRLWVGGGLAERVYPTGSQEAQASAVLRRKGGAKGKKS